MKIRYFILATVAFAFLRVALGSPQATAPNIQETNTFEQIRAHKLADGSNVTAAAEERSRKLAQGMWEAYLPHYQFSLSALNDELMREAAQQSDRISKSEGYFTSIPDKPYNRGEQFQVAEIKFQKNTNMDFTVSVSGPNPANYGQLTISCEAGYLKTDGERGDFFRCDLHVAPDFDDGGRTNYSNADKMIAAFVKELVAAQIDYLSRTNK